MSRDRIPEPAGVIGGGTFLLLFVLSCFFCWLGWQSGEFRECDPLKYETQLVCIVKAGDR